MLAQYKERTDRWLAVVKPEVDGGLLKRHFAMMQPLFADQSPFSKQIQQIQFGDDQVTLEAIANGGRAERRSSLEIRANGTITRKDVTTVFDPQELSHSVRRLFSKSVFTKGLGVLSIHTLNRVPYRFKTITAAQRDYFTSYDQFRSTLELSRWKGDSGEVAAIRGALPYPSVLTHGEKGVQFILDDTGRWTNKENDLKYIYPMSFWLARRLTQVYGYPLGWKTKFWDFANTMQQKVEQAIASPTVGPQK